VGETVGEWRENALVATRRHANENLMPHEIEEFRVLF